MKSSHLQIRLTVAQKEAIRKASAAAGLEMTEWILKKIFPGPKVKFLLLLNALKLVENKPDRRFVLNDLNAFLSGLDAHLLTEVVMDDPGLSFGALMENYVAAMVEEACVRQGCHPPQWSSECRGVKEPYFATAMSSLRLYLLCNAPVAFRKRNIFVDSTVGDLV